MSIDKHRGNITLPDVAPFDLMLRSGTAITLRKIARQRSRARIAYCTRGGSMRPICCPQCGAEGLVQHKHLLTDGRAFTQYYCEYCVKAWVERAGESPAATRLPQRHPVRRWTERYVAAFHFPVFRAWKQVESGSHEDPPHSDDPGAASPAPESSPHSSR